MGTAWIVGDGATPSLAGPEHSYAVGGTDLMSQAVNDDSSDHASLSGAVAVAPIQGGAR